MTDRPKTTEPKELARAARLAIEAARALNILHSELAALGEEVSSLRYAVSRSSKEIMEDALNLPGLRIAVFPIEDKTGEGK